MLKTCKYILLFIFISCFSLTFSKDDEKQIGQLPYCESEGNINEIKRLVFVSTLDGRLSALNIDDGGTEKWSVPTGPGPMLSSSIHSLELTNNGQWIRMIPSLNGGLYKFNGEHIEAVPINADNLLKSSFRYSDELIISGGKESRTYGVDVSTGRVLYECSMNRCDNTTDDEIVPGDIVLVQRNTQTVRAVEPRSGIERWNFSVGQHDLKVAPDPSASCHTKKTDTSSDLLLKVIVPDGLVCAMSRTKPGKVIWQHKFNFPVVSAWHVDKGELKWVDLFGGNKSPEDKSYFPESPVLYIGMHNKQLYIQESVRLQHKIIESSNMRLQQHLITDESSFPRIPWRPVPAGLLGIAGSKEPTLQITDETSQAATTALSVLYGTEYVNGNGFYLYDSNKDKALCVSKEKINITIDRIESETDLDGNIVFEEDEISVQEEEDDTPVQVIIVSFWSWWIEVLVTSITLAIFVNLIIQRRFIRLLYSGRILNEERSEESLPDSLGLQNINSTNGFMNSSPEFVSRYLTDFEPINCLGKGGFGVVFEAKNKIDDCNYAIKRIPLPHREELHDRMKREVKALAKLDHQNIVRYFNSWVEDPPPNWQESQDKMWAKLYTDGGSDVMVDLTGQVTPISETPSTPQHKQKNIIKSLWDKANNFYASNSRLEKSIAKSPLPTRVTDDVSDASYIVFERSKKDCGGGGDAEECNTEEFSKHSETTATKKSDIVKNRPTTLDLTPGGISGSSPSSVGPHNRKYLYIQMQLCQRDTLKDWLRANPNRDKENILDIFNQIVRAVEYVHLKGLIHRDLKPSNIFFSLDGQIKIGDFGLVTAMIEDDCDEYTSPVLGKRFYDERHTARVGTQLYMSPEQVSGKQYDYKVDIYSLGVILFELLINFTTEMERYKTLNLVRKNQFPQCFNENYPHEYKLLQMMLSENPKLRPTTIGIRSRPPLRRFQSESGDHVLNSDQWHFQLPQRHRDSSFSKCPSSQESSSSS
ncbi:hypothetical protein O3M35_006804 [Rhynocoris fuscipes]|uniref:non-specific serine/threonine protein kinase n=1 Tax=Rhynocoris fuscipes TaxID=488301 RepID=A0AAW1DM04_9HEMI